jgi:hypothetical protein
MGRCRPSRRNLGMKAKLEINPVPGSELQDLVDQVAAAPPEVLDLVRKVSAR